ncbi:MAG: alpha/beta fold hydrolase [Ferruginibacter sp.]|nr:alpha/beta fold hydrolase [Cytophagales bacterium]
MLESPPITSEPVVLETSTGRLYGTVDLPRSAAPFPVALLIAGSGPTDRDGNSAALPGANNSLKLLAQGLATQGIASVRYDKRGIAESAKAGTSETDLRFDTYVDDAVRWGKQLREDKRFSKLVVIGHSEGALIGTVATQKMQADAFISIAGAGRPAPQLILDQVKGKLPPDLQRQTERVLQRLTEGKTTGEVPAPLAALFRPSVQPYLISWFRYDPAQEIAKITVPTLVVQGTTDVQVSTEEAKLLAKAKPAAKLLIVEGMNHVLKEVPLDNAQQVKSYRDATLPVAPQLLRELGVFIKQPVGN